MSRFPTHAVEDAPEASRPLLQKIAQSSPTGRPLNAHAQLADAFAQLGLTVFTGCFLNYAQTEPDI
jgi:hypothetical protein